jgi:7-keto-8-aminopelargonate synthetase-like enzyme
VPLGEECFRITPTPLHTEAHINALASALIAVCGQSVLKKAA